MKIDGLIRRLERLAGGDHPVGQDEFGNLTVTQALPEFARLAAAGKLFSVDMTAGTSKIPVTAAPTSSPEWGLFNASESETLVVLELGCSLESGVAGLGLAIMAASAIGPQTQVSSDYANTVKSCLDGSTRQPEFYLADNPTLIGAVPSWSIVAQTPVNSIGNDGVGEGLTAKVHGAFVARPRGGMVAFEIVGETGTAAKFDVSAIVAMLDLDLY